MLYITQGFHAGGWLCVILSPVHLSFPAFGKALS